MKRFLFLALALILTFAFVSCGNKEENNKEFTRGVVEGITFAFAKLGELLKK